MGTSTTACPTNGRNDPASADGLARKVLVIMTDGFSQGPLTIAPGLDELLNTIASSSPGSFDHYFPIAKSEGASLPQLFRVMAGSIARGRLQ